jgi:hypothetical protein
MPPFLKMKSEKRSQKFTTVQKGNFWSSKLKTFWGHDQEAQPHHIKGGDRRRFGPNVSILPQPPKHSSPRSEAAHDLTWRPQPVVHDYTDGSLRKGHPRTVLVEAKGLQTFTRSRPSSTTMADELALRHDKQIPCNSSGSVQVRSVMILMLMFMFMSLILHLASRASHNHTFVLESFCSHA